MNVPLVSVLITAYNRENFIGEAVESVLASTYTNFELIIIDDCSTDDTVHIARAYQTKDKRVRIFENERNIGQFKNRNRAAEVANGTFIFYVDSDDTVLPNGIELLVQTMRRYPNASFGMYWNQTPDKEVVELNSKTAIYNHFFRAPFLLMGPGGTIIRRNFFLEIGGYTEKYNAAGDMYFNLKACSFSPIVRLPFEFMTYRRHDGQELNSPYEYLYNSYRYLREALVELPLQLSNNELKWLRKKNSRRFLVNIMKYLIRTRDLKATNTAIKNSNFKLKDAFEGIFH